MKKILIITSLFFSFKLFSQFQSNGILISTGLSFSKKETFTPLSPAFQNLPNQQPNQIIQTAYNVSPEISYVVNSKFMIGLGYSSVQSKREFNGTSGFGTSNGVVTSVSKTTSTTENKLSGLSLHMRYSQNVTSNFIFSLKFTYFNWKGEAKNESVTTRTPPSNSITPISSNSTFDFGEARFSPSIHYFISKNFGCYIETTGLNLRFSDSRKINKDVDYDFDLNPNTWRVGLFYFIPTQKAIE